MNAFAGGDSLEPFLKYEDKGIFVWCRSSNPGAVELQDLKLAQEGGERPLYEWIALRSREWNRQGNVGLVVGATYPEQLGAVRSLCPGVPILIPGVGSQGGDLANSVRVGLDGEAPNILINSSRGVIYASKDRDNFAQAARSAASSIRDNINVVLEREGRGW